MYQSNQARIKKEIPSLLPGRGQTPRCRISLTLAALAVNSTRGYCSASAAVAPLASPSQSSTHITIWYQRLGSDVDLAAHLHHSAAGHPRCRAAA